MTDFNLPADFYNSHGEKVVSIVEGSAEGTVSVYIHKGDIENVRNIQGGTVDDPNLDISAGGAGGPDDPRGVLSLNFDNGRGVDIGRGRPNRAPAMKLRTYDDYKKDLATWGVPVRFAKGALVQRTDGTWRRL